MKGGRVLSYYMPSSIVSCCWCEGAVGGPGGGPAPVLAEGRARQAEQGEAAERHHGEDTEEGTEQLEVLLPTGRAARRRS
jgi:hypothetical protein